MFIRNKQDNAADDVALAAVLRNMTALLKSWFDKLLP